MRPGEEGMEGWCVRATLKKKLYLPDPGKTRNLEERKRHKTDATPDIIYLQAQIIAEIEES